MAADYSGRNPIFLGVLKGSFIFLADFLRELYKAGLKDVEVDFVSVSSYGKEKVYQGSEILQDTTLDLAGRDILIVEDIVDTGNTLAFLLEHLRQKNPSTIEILALLDKKEKREVEIIAKYTGFTLDGAPWVEGYGLDGELYGRGRPEIAKMDI